MANSYTASRAHLVFALCLPLAVLLGYMLAYSPSSGSSRFFVVALIGMLSVPVLMNWYHPLLILTWNAAITPFFLPGQPFIWMLVAFIGVGFAIVSRLTTPEARFIPVPSINRAMLFLLAVVIITAYLKGGVGLRAFGSSQHGGRGYFYLAGAIAGYFALISKRLPKERAGILVGIFFLSALTSLVPNLAYFGGPQYAFLYYLFPPVYAYEQALGDYSIGRDFTRIYGLTFASNGLYCYLIARYGLQGIFNLSKPFRLLLFVAAAVGCLFCGFRSFMLLFLLTIVSQFFCERLFRARVLLSVATCLVIACAVALPLVDKLPTVVQRTISFIPDSLLPVDIGQAIRQNADASSEWRWMMWKEVLPEVPRYLLVGKGYNLDPFELEMAMQNDRRGYSLYGWALVTGAYHNGALTLLIPFGIFGGLAFLWLTVASIKYLYWCFRYGDPDLKMINTFLLSYFVARLIYYFGVFGSFYTDFFVFAGIIGLSVSLNGAQSEEVAEAPLELPVPEPAAVSER